MIDTAGIRETSDQVEHIGVEKARSACESSDFLICVLDASEELTEEDREVLDLCMEKPSVVLLNKSDLTAVVSEEMIRELLVVGSDADLDSGDDRDLDEDMDSASDADSYGSDLVSVLSFSAETGEGLRELESLLEELFLKEFFDDATVGNDSSFDSSYGSRHSFGKEPVITSLRQKEALQDVKESIKRIRQTIDAGMPEDLLTVDLLAVYESLGRVTGDTLEDDLVDKIFSDFCMGK